MMKSALQVMLTTRRGIIVFMAHVTMLDATAAYPNHIGHSMCLINSILFPRLARYSPPVRMHPSRPSVGTDRGPTINTAARHEDKRRCRPDLAFCKRC